MKFHVTMNCDNAAFGDNPNQEVARLLMELAQRVAHGDLDIGSAFGRTQYRSLFDANGNNVGAASYIKES